jgi:hypothetical protein
MSVSKQNDTFIYLISLNMLLNRVPKIVLTVLDFATQH